MERTRRIADKDVAGALTELGRPVSPMDVARKLNLAPSQRTTVLYHLKRLVEQGTALHLEGGTYSIAESSEQDLSILRRIPYEGIAVDALASQTRGRREPKTAFLQSLKTLENRGYVHERAGKVWLTPSGARRVARCYYCGKDLGDGPVIIAIRETTTSFGLGEETAHKEEIEAPNEQPQGSVEVLLVHARCEAIRDRDSETAASDTTCAYCGLPLSPWIAQVPVVTYRDLSHVLTHGELAALLGLDVGTESLYDDLAASGEQVTMALNEGRTLSELVKLVLPKGGRIRPPNASVLAAMLRIRIILTQDLSERSNAEQLAELLGGYALGSNAAQMASRGREIWMAAWQVKRGSQRRLVRAYDRLCGPWGTFYSLAPSLWESDEALASTQAAETRSSFERGAQAFVVRKEGTNYHPLCSALLDAAENRKSPNGRASQ